MTERTTHTSVTFVRPFSLPDLEDVQPAGTYLIETVDTLLDGITFLAYRRMSTTIELPAIGGTGPQRQVIAIDPVELKVALEADAQPRIGSSQS